MKKVLLLQSSDVRKYLGFIKNCPNVELLANLARGYKTFFMVNSAEHEVYPAHKCCILTFMSRKNDWF